MTLAFSPVLLSTYMLFTFSFPASLFIVIHECVFVYIIVLEEECASFSDCLTLMKGVYKNTRTCSTRVSDCVTARVPAAEAVLPALLPACISRVKHALLAAEMPRQTASTPKIHARSNSVSRSSQLARSRDAQVVT